MATSRPRLNSLAAIIVGCGLGAVSLASQSAPAPAYPNAPAGFDVRQSGIQSGRVERVEYDSKVTGNKRPAIVYTPPGYSAARKYPGAVPAAWNWRQRKPLDAVRRGGRDSRQSDCRQQGRPHDHRDAQRPCVERTVDDVRRQGAGCWRPRCRSSGCRGGRDSSGRPGRNASWRARPAPRLERMGADAAVPAAREWPSSSPPTRRSSGNWSAT